MPIFFFKKKEINLDKSILSDPIVKELGRYPFKEFDRTTPQEIILDPSSTSGSSGALRRMDIQKEEKALTYYKKQFLRSKKIDNTDSSLSLQELIAGNLYRITGCKAPKQKIFVRKIRGDSKYAPRVDAGSKSLDLRQLKDKSDLLQYIRNWETDGNLKALKEISRLMGATLALGDYDRNPANYYFDLKDGLFGKMDHDRTFTRPRNDRHAYADPNFVIHVYFIEALCQKKSIADQTINTLTDNLNDNIRRSENASRYSQFDDGLFKLDTRSKEWSYNPEVFNTQTIDRIKENDADTFMFVSFLKSVRNFTDMPQEIKSYLFKPKNLLGDVWGKLPLHTQEDLLLHGKRLFDKFEENLKDLRGILELPLQRLNELEESLRQKGAPVPKISVNYDAAVKFITTAQKNHMTLHQLKELIKNTKDLEEKKGFQFFLR